MTTMGGYWVKTNSQTIKGIKLFKRNIFQAQRGQQGQLFGSLSCPRRSHECHQKHEYQGATFPLLKYKQTHQDKCEYQGATLFIPLYKFKQAL